MWMLKYNKAYLFTSFVDRSIFIFSNENKYTKIISF